MVTFVSPLIVQLFTRTCAQCLASLIITAQAKKLASNTHLLGLTQKTPQPVKHQFGPLLDIQ
jgi:hypothetical protein